MNNLPLTDVTVKGWLQRNNAVTYCSQSTTLCGWVQLWKCGCNWGYKIIACYYSFSIHGTFPLNICFFLCLKPTFFLYIKNLFWRKFNAICVLGGSLFLFDRKALRYFRKDGHRWRKKKDGKTVREAHEKLKVCSFITFIRDWLISNWLGLISFKDVITSILLFSSILQRVYALCNLLCKSNIICSSSLILTSYQYDIRTLYVRHVWISGSSNMAWFNAIVNVAPIGVMYDLLTIQMGRFVPYFLPWKRGPYSILKAATWCIVLNAHKSRLFPPKSK